MEVAVSEFNAVEQRKSEALNSEGLNGGDSHAGEVGGTTSDFSGQEPTVEQTHAEAGTTTALLSDPDLLRDQWSAVQAEFVDDPRRAVGDAEHLVASVMNDLIERFREQRERLDSQWSDNTESSTDELRMAIQRYRDFFDRLLSV